MRTPPPHPQEAERLTLLHQLSLLDSQPDPEFDDLVHLASELAGTPVALVSLVDRQRQWFLARHGLDARETPRDVAFCAHAILAPDQPLVVEDARTDPRFAGNPLVHGAPRVISYAGFPVCVGPMRLPLGTLCVIDHRAHRLSTATLAQLRLLARAVERILELRLANRSLQVALAEATGRRQAEQRLNEATAFQQAILDAAHHAIIATTLDGTITAFNTGAERLLGWRADEMVGLRTPAVIHVAAEVAHRAAELSHELGHPVAVGFEAFVAWARERNAPDEREWTYVRKDGSQVPVQLSVTVIRDDTGTPTGYLGIASDISARKELERSLSSARDAALDSARAKSEFLATMSHEIRTPMNGIIGMSEQLVRTRLDPQQRELAETVRGCGEGLLTIINDILDFSKIDAGRLVLEHIPVSLTRLAQEVAALLAVQAEAKGVQLACACDPQLPPWVAGDPTRLRQVLLNLVSNAVKFTDQGAVRIAVRPLPHDRIELVVSDTGIGMDAAQVARLGQAFCQADASTTRRYGGTGLGITICLRLVALMGGRVDIASQPGQGTTITVVLGLPTTAPPPSVAEASPIRRSLRLARVLVAEDNPVNQRLAALMLEGLAESIDLVANGAAAVEAHARRPYDAILMDCQMPRLDGFAATERIRAHEAATGHRRTPIIALTANALTGDRERCLAAGMDDYLSKPLRADDLVRLLGQHCGAGAAVADLHRQLTQQLGAEVVAELVEIARSAFPHDLADAEHHLAERNLPGVAAAAHRIKGGALSLELAELATLSGQLERRARDGDATAATGLLAGVRASAERSLILLNALPTG